MQPWDPGTINYRCLRYMIHATAGRPDGVDAAEELHHTPLPSTTASGPDSYAGPMSDSDRGPLRVLVELEPDARPFEIFSIVDARGRVR